MIYNIAKRYAFSSKNRHKLTSIRIAIGLLFSTLALNVILSFMIGLQDKKFSLIKEYQSYDAILEVNEEIDIESFLNEFNSKDDIDLAFKFLEIPTIIRNDDNSQFIGSIRAFKEEDFNKLSYSLIKGKFDSDGVILSYSATQNSNLNYLKPINLTILKKGKVVTIVPFQTTDNISAVYFTPMKDFNNYYVIMEYNKLKKYAPYSKDKIGVFGNIETIKNLSKNKAKVLSWKDQNESLYAAMKLEQYLMYLTLSIMSLIIIIQLYNSTINLVKSKKGEIAMLRALGLTKKETKNVFVISSLIVSLLGIVLGSIISFFLLNYSNSIISFFNNITNYSIPLLSVDVNLSFSIKNCFIIATPLILIILVMSKRVINKLLKNDSMEILLNE